MIFISINVTRFLIQHVDATWVHLPEGSLVDKKLLNHLKFPMFTPSMITGNTKELAWLGRVEDLFLRFGIKSVSMDDVAADLGISKKTLYQMVESKDDLVIKVLDHHITREKSQYKELASKAANALDEILILMDCNSQDLSQMKSNVVYDLQKYHRKAWEMMQQYQFDFVIKIITENLHRGRKEGIYREDFDIDIIAKIHLATVFSLFDPRLFPDGSTSKVTLLKEYMLHYLHGIVTTKGLSYLKKKIH